MTKRIDMIGRKYGALWVSSLAGQYRSPGGTCRDYTWLCRCDCGNEHTVRGSYLRNGHTKSCGKCQRYATHGDYMSCICKNGRQFLFDASDYEMISQYSWSVDRLGYVLTGNGRLGSKLHRMLMLPDKDQVVDHINGDPSDCRKSNLRIVSQGQNTCNQRLPKSSTTGYKGVCFDKRRQTYLAHIHPENKYVFLGYYASPEEAAIAYNEAAFKLFGEYARLNVIGQPFKTISATHCDGKMDVEVLA